MKKYIIKRLLQLIPILFGITLLTFVLMHTSSVDAVDMMEQNTGMAWTEEQKAAVREELGLDKSVPVQYLNWVGNMLKGDMGTSYISGQPVLQMFLSKLPMTIYLTITSILLTIALSIPLGILSAVRKNKFTDYFIRILSFIGNSMPGFFVALLLVSGDGKRSGMEKYRSADTDAGNCHVRKIYQTDSGNRSGRTEKRLRGRSPCAGRQRAKNPGWKCVESIHADHRNAAVTVHRFVTWRNCHHGVDLYVGWRWKNGSGCDFDQRLSGDTGVCGLDGDYLCDGKSGDGYHLPLSGSAYPVTGKFLRKQEMITCERKRQK